MSLSDEDPVVSRYAVQTGPGVRVAHVGTYERQDIGASCYHGSLAILENLLSHAQFGSGEWIVCDMVAGTDRPSRRPATCSPACRPAPRTRR